MYKLFNYLLLLSFIFTACQNSNQSNVGTKATPEDLKLEEGTEFSLEDAAAANNQAGLSIFLAKRQAAQNLFISPYSISSALAMTYLGARNATEDEMRKVMYWPANSKGLHTGLGNQMKTLDAAADQLFKVNVANRIYVKEGLKLFKEFSEVNQDIYGAGVQALSFEDVDKAANTINNWVSQKTEKMIPKLLDPKLLDGAEMVLVNAIFFYGGWANPFKEESTEKDSFFVQSDQIKMIDMMSRYWAHDNDELEEGFNYYEDAEFQVLELPYHEAKGSMIIFLPQKNDSMTYHLDSLMEKITYEDIVGRINALEYFSGNLNLKLPKWKQRTSALLKPTLEKLGMQKSFSNVAEFPAMTDEIQLKISEVVHEAVIEVSEKGTKAAAATAVITKETSAAPQEVRELSFIANRPFFYLIKDKQTNTFLFMGQFVKPE
jgi:serpin B